MADQLRWDVLGCAGHPDVRTPNIDALASHGVRFSQALCQSTDCDTSHASVLTGEYPRAQGVSGGGTGTLREGTSLSALLKAKGYRTAALGKVGPVTQEGACGFDVVSCVSDYEAWLESEGQVDRTTTWAGATDDAAPKSFRQAFGAVRSNLAEKYHVTTWVGDQAVRFFQSTSEPFFLWASFSKPSFPFDPPRGYAGLYKQKDLTLPPGYRSTLAAEDADVESKFDLQSMGEPQFRKVLAYYYAAVSHLDKQVGRILATLTARGITNNLFVFCADHGDYMGEHGLILKDGAQVYDPVLRVPLIVAGKAGQRHGVVDASMVELCDIMPTLLDVAGAQKPTQVTGKSLAPLLMKAKAPLRKVGRSFPRDGIQVARSARYKLVESSETSRQAFFDLKADPHEFDNLYGQSKVKVHQAMLKAALKVK